MTTPNASRSKILAVALDAVLTPVQMTAAREFILAEVPGRTAPSPEEILYWMRVNMPLATRRVEDILYSHE
jgi:hypothetical protein